MIGVFFFDAVFFVALTFELTLVCFFCMTFVLASIACFFFTDAADFVC